MKTIAIDFETANELRSSPCAIGLAWIDNAQVSRREYRLIRPPEMRFSSYNIRVHHITPEQVAFSPEFPQIFAEFESELSGSLILAHNADFDVAVLCETLAQYGMVAPQFSCICTMDIAKSVWPDLASVSLDFVASECGVMFSHHNAGDDAYACAKIAIAASEAIGAAEVCDIPNLIHLRRGLVTVGSWRLPKRSSNLRAKRRLSGKLTFSVRGRTGNTYYIEASNIDGVVRISCTCQAGRNRRWCHHRTALLDGDITNLLSDNADDVLVLKDYPNPRP